MLIDNKESSDDYDGNEALGGDSLDGNQGKNFSLRDNSGIMQNWQLSVQANCVKSHILFSDIECFVVPFTGEAY